MIKKIYSIQKEGREISNIERAGDVTILDAALGVAYSETEANFNAYLNELKKYGYTIIENS
jgi:hypothetical protein